MLKKVLVSALVAATMATSAVAQSGGPATVPNGPYGDNDSIASLLSYDQLIRALESSVKTSHGAATLHYAKWPSNSGRKVPYVVIGNGPTAVMIIAQQHGDEMETSDSAVNLVRTLSNNSMESRAIRNSLKVIVVPRVNVDGFDGTNPDGTLLMGATGTAEHPPPQRRFQARRRARHAPPGYPGE